MPLIDLNPKAALTDADIPQLIARDTETSAAIAQAMIDGFSVMPRTGGNTGITIDANTTIAPGKAAVIRWIDGNNTYANFPYTTVSGTLFQFDTLYNTVLVGKYMIQLFGLPDQSKISYRSQINGNWGAWVPLA